MNHRIRIAGDMFGNNYYCLMRTNTNTFVCFDDSLLDYEPGELRGVHVIEMTDEQAWKVKEVLDATKKWSMVWVIDGTMQELRDAIREWRALGWQTAKRNSVK